MHAIGQAKRMMEISIQIYIKIPYNDDSGQESGRKMAKYNSQLPIKGAKMRREGVSDKE